METKPETDHTTPSTALFVSIVVGAWQTQYTRVNELLESLSDRLLE